MKSIKQYLKLLPLAVVLLVLSACVKSFDGIVDDASTNRPFLPGSFGVKTAKDSAVFSWTAPVLSSGKRYTYTVDISQDSSFHSIDLTKTVDTLGFVVVEPTLAVAKKYYARLVVNPFKGSDSSRYYYLSKSFTINGLNYLRVIRDYEINPTTALIHWYVNANTTNIDKIVLSVNGSVATTFTISPTEIAAGSKLLNNLTPNTKYTLQLFAGAKSRGIMSFTTPNTVTYTKTLSAGGDLVGAINAAADGDVIGLNPGTYTLGTSVFTITGKSVSIRSTSNNAADTKINVREIDLAGNGAGLILAGVEINGNYTGTSFGVQFLNLRGLVAVGDPTNFADVKLDNCIIHDYTRCLILGNNATTVNTHTIKSYIINNCIIYNIDKAGTSTYYNISLEKTLLNSFSITKSTFYNMGTGLFNMGTALAASAIVPVITVDYCTFNNFGGGSKYLFIDANTNKISYALRNSILANSPQAGTTQVNASRSTGSGSTNDFLNNNYFNLYSNGANSTPLILTGLNQVGSLNINLGWTATTQTFSLQALPSTSPIFTASTSGSTIGDPRWAY
ncbi:MAG: DUF4957 domain-containing protein [Mucilaginibacter sp.]|uniref:DUF4957 domain-containing protein n=1 Tax=Mucilaginibacter sp. TaxID=1882438 RepID=UPI0032660855